VRVKLVAGLGNPGERYRGTRHNVGFEVVDLVAREHRLTFDAADRARAALTARWRRDGEMVLLAKPQTFMNVSGEAVRALVEFYKVELIDVLVVCDDVNLPLGRLRGRASGSEGGHNGLRSVAESLGTDEYARLRVGVGRGREEEGAVRRGLAGHVLAEFEPDEAPGIASAIARAAEAVQVWTTGGLAPMMTVFNRAAVDPEP
jgi:PTH1 family peptidyl-tRNA hydrolase